MLLYYITDRSQFSGDETSRRRQLLDKIAEAASYGIDFVQLREKDLLSRELMNVAEEALRIIGQVPKSPTRLLINARTDIAISAGAAGVHLRSVDISAEDVRQIWTSSASVPGPPVITVSCHTLTEIDLAAKSGADFALFGPVFEKNGRPTATPTGIAKVREAASQIPVIVLGGVAIENAEACVNAGATGIAGIRIFQENDISQVISQLRA